jgi:hypothetical protein
VRVIENGTRFDDVFCYGLVCGAGCAISDSIADSCTVSDIVAVNADLFASGSRTTCARQPLAGP